jgi:kynurenine 3-monooxygenase
MTPKKLKEKVVIVGGGLVGPLLSIYLAKRGCPVEIIERRPNPRQVLSAEGRSINLALSHRGLKALSEVGLSEKVSQLMIPMKGRMIHDPAGNLSYLPYSKDGQFINSVSRGQLNNLLLDTAEEAGVRINFNQRCIQTDFTSGKLTTQDTLSTKVINHSYDVLIGADGAFSEVRYALQKTERFNFSQKYLSHGYKELTIAPINNDFAMEKNALHIWPRGEFMLIALPNTDKTFTCTLFLPLEGDNSFARLKTEADVTAFFKQNFSDALPLISRLSSEFFKHPTSHLVCIECFPWSKFGNTLLIGDAAHAIVPFYGQGMNAGFEDCRILNQLLEENNRWDEALESFQYHRKRDADAIAALALNNFTEMRELVGKPDFILRKKIEARIQDLFPTSWKPLYSMVTFTDTPYSEAFALGKRQDLVLDQIMEIPGIEEIWEQINLEPFLSKLDPSKQSYQN